MHHQEFEARGGFRGFIREGFGRGEHRGERGGHHWRGGGRPFDHGELRWVILALIAERPRHGYEIIKAIEDRFGGSYTPSPGVVYPTLTMLEELGQATVEETGGKKLYTVTDEGRAVLAANQAVADRAMDRMGEFSEANRGGRSPQMIRAVANLKMALKLKMHSGPLTEDQMKSIVAAIDAAAVAIERS